MLTSKQRAYLKGEANQMETILIVGKGGISDDVVQQAVDALRKRREVKGEKVAVIGGGHVGCEVALWLKDNGVQDVTLIEAQPELLMAAEPEPIPLANKLMLLDQLDYHGVKVLKGTFVRKVVPGEVIVARGGEESAVAADTVILAIGFAPENTLYNQLNAMLPKQIWCIGDAKTPTNIMFGIRDANAVARLL